MSGIVIGGRLLNPKSLEDKLENAFKKWADDDVDGAYFEDQFKDDKWEYPGITERKSGQVVGPEPRDIYDLGTLYRSGKDSFTLRRSGSRAEASWNWDATNDSGGAYAWYVHEGLSTNLEPRQWTDVFQSAILFDASAVKKALLLRIKEEMRQ